MPNSKNLYVLKVDCGEKELRDIITGMVKYYSPNELIGQKLIFLTNLESRKFLGHESQGMLLAADVDNQPILLKLDEQKREIVPPGSEIK